MSTHGLMGMLTFRRRDPRALALLPLLCVLASCATPGVGTRQETAATLLTEAHHAKDPAAQIGFALAAADKAAGNLGDERLTYNAACVELAARVGKSTGGVFLPATFSTPSGTYRLEFNATHQVGAWDPPCFAKLLPTDEIANKRLVSKQPLSGYGGALVGVSIPPNPRELLLPKVGVSAPVTAVVNFSKPARPGDPTRATLTLYDPTKRNTALVIGERRPLAADFTAPFGYYPNPGETGILGMLDPGRYLEKEGFFLVQPYDSKKVPIVFVHGLMSVPQMWLPVMAALESDPVLRGKFQFWVFAYPTGDPIAYSALQLRRALASVYKVYPRTRDMVIINHSLGGDLTHLQVIDTSDVLVKGIFKQNAPQIMALPPNDLIKQALVFKANPRIKRVVFVAAPHRGAPLAINFIGRFGAALIHLPGQVISDIGTATIEEAAIAAGLKKNFLPNSINGLEPSSPLLISMNEVPIRVPFHSIIGVAGQPKAPLEKTSDTVVPYWSSHLNAALSEKIVPYPHTAMFVKPEAIDEIKRILRLHLASIGDVH
jgi:pimeloyl-ACP methyl ester carboxylesterase